MTFVLPCVRAFRKYQTLSCLIGPPNDPFTSYTFESGVGAASPAARSASLKLSPDNFLPVKLMKSAPDFLLPPVLGTTLITRPAVSDSPSPPAVVNVTSWALPTSATYDGGWLPPGGLPMLSPSTVIRP